MPSALKFPNPVIGLNQKMFRTRKVLPFQDMSADNLFGKEVLTSKPITALRQATAADIGAARFYAEGFGAVDRMLYTCAGQYGQRNGGL